MQKQKLINYAELSKIQASYEELRIFNQLYQDELSSKILEELHREQRPKDKIPIECEEQII